MSKVLLVDDDVELTEMLVDYLSRDGFDVDASNDSEQGLAQALSGNFDLAILDVMTPRVGGIEILNRIRAQSRLPVIMLSAKGDDADRIVGLELGADDYVPKPCTAREISARIRAILRRVETQSQLSSALPIVVGGLVIWPQQRLAKLDDRPLDLTSTEFNLLEVLARHAGRTVSKGELCEQALGRPLAKFDRSIEVHLSSIRQKLGSLPDGRSYIQTVFRQGYQLIRG